MELDLDLLRGFEAGLNPLDVEGLEVVGYGEMSTIFQIPGDGGRVYKRMPLFSCVQGARDYERLHGIYCDLLGRAGIDLPEWGTAVVALPQGPVVLYIAQEYIPGDWICHHGIRGGDWALARRILAKILIASQGVWAFSRDYGPGLELALDGQLSNWALDSGGRLLYLDTGTPFIRCRGAHLLDWDLFLGILPKGVRWCVPEALARGVLDRYHDPRKNMVDLLANLYKEGRPDLIPGLIPLVNQALPRGSAPIDAREVKVYYRGDRAIWQLFEGLRKVDRWICSRLLGRGYDFILPGTINR